MKRLLAIALLFSSIQVCQAQIFVNVYDNNNDLVGQPYPWSANTLAPIVFRPDGNAVFVNFHTGQLEDHPYNTIYFSDLACEGQAYVDGGPVAFNWISPYGDHVSPKPLFLVMQDAPQASVMVNSYATDSSPGCVNSSSTESVRPVVLIHPSDYGFIVTPGGEWGYAPPLKTKIIDVQEAADVLFCNSFESCPTP